MSKIIVLDQLVANKIAAGEVIEKPSSVVKELIENSIDASATAITVEIKNGGISFIRVTDNGAGIANEDLQTAFLRHATSKISKAEDLDNITTLGFRGEALASIAAVSKVELITKTKQSITGSLAEIEGGKVVRTEEIGCPNGTTILIKELFYNTPARLKFLKKESIEAGLVSDIVERVALTHPEISFKLINNNQTILHTSGNGDSLSTILSIFGKDFAKAMIPINQEAEGIKVYGFAGKPEISRSNRNYQCFIINNRFIKSKILYTALDEAYKTMVMVNKYPVAIIFIDIAPDKIDINVHPTKMEVRFDDENGIYNEVYNAVKDSITKQAFIPQVKLEQTHITKKETARVNQTLDNNKHIFKTNDFIINEKPNETYDVKIKQEPIKPFKPIKEEISIKELEQETISIKNNYKIIGQLFSTYILIEMDGSMYIIDQHAAHERIKYNNLMKKFQESGISSQSVITPIVVNLSFREHKTALENIELIKEMGYEIEEFGDNAFLIRSVPYILGENLAKDFFIELIDNLSNKKIKDFTDLKSDTIYSMACKSAIKANNTLNLAEIKELVNNVVNMHEPYTCPHGRPIMVSISKYEVEKMFKRIQ